MSRGDRCIEPPGVVPEQRGKGGEVTAQPINQLLDRSRGEPEHQRSVPERARRLDERRAGKRRTGVHPRADRRAPSRRRAGPARSKVPMAPKRPIRAVERTVRRVEEPGLVEERRDAEGAADLGEAPALAPGGEHLPERQRRARRERDLGALGMARAGEAGRGVGREHERCALGHPGHRLRRAAPGRAEDPGRSLRGDEGARAGADRRRPARAGRRRPARRRACWCRPRPRCRGFAG